jgi:hypothetical protein
MHVGGDVCFSLTPYVSYTYFHASPLPKKRNFLGMYIVHCNKKEIFYVKNKYKLTCLIVAKICKSSGYKIRDNCVCIFIDGVILEYMDFKCLAKVMV